jgi:hypothetical protein
MKTKRLILIHLFLLLFFSVSFAAWDKKPEFRWGQLYRYDLRQDNHQLYTNRLSATFTYKNKKDKAMFRLQPFFEIRRNTHKDLWERKELGLEIGKDIFPWLYIGEAIQRGWMKEDYRDYAKYEKRDYVDSETRLLFMHNLLSSKYVKLKAFILEEYTYDFDRGAGRCNEVAIGLIMPIGKYIETGINWRHIDRIHHYDSDTFETSVTLVF